MSASHPPSVASLNRLAHRGYLTHHSRRLAHSFKLFCWLCCLYLFCLHLALSISLCAALCLTGCLFLSRSMARLLLLWARSFYWSLSSLSVLVSEREPVGARCCTTAGFSFAVDLLRIQSKSWLMSSVLLPVGVGTSAQGFHSIFWCRNVVELKPFCCFSCLCNSRFVR